MPELSQGGVMSIVAHQDDDILFMNPDIAQSIARGEANTTIFVTAGDAGLDEAYWRGREMGAKAAYSAMTGHDEWVDEIVEVEIDGQTVSVASSYLVEAPEIRLYFLRLPDGGGALAPGEEQQLARLESGELATIMAVDGSATYTREGLVQVLTGLMELHTPSAFRLQVHEGETAAAEHTDHTHTAEFSEEALAAYSGGIVQVTHYVHYDSRLMPANLSPEDAAFALEVMLAYAEHDPAVLAEDGSLAEPYATWTGRQYIAETYLLDTEADDAPADPEPGNTWPDAGDWTYSLEGPDSFLFQINAATGAVTPHDWFVPSLDDAWDQDEDFIYEVTRVATPLDGGEPQSQVLVFETTAEGVLALLTEDGTVPDDTGGGDDTADGGDGSDRIDGPDGEDTTDGPDGGGGQGAPDFPPGTRFSLDGPDAFLFEIDTDTGEITPKDWFIPSRDDAWDQNEDHIYDLVRIGTPPDGGAVIEELVQFETQADGTFVQLGGAAAEEAAPAAPPPDGGGADPASGEEAPADPVAEVDEDLVYALSGPDALVFTIDPETGAIAFQDWFDPAPGDAWDVNEDHVYEVTRTSVAPDGSAGPTDDLRLELGPDGNAVPVADDAGQMLRQAAPAADADVFLF